MIVFIKAAWLTLQRFLTGERCKKLWEFAKSFFNKKKECQEGEQEPSSKMMSILEDSSGGYSAMRFALILTITTVMYFWALSAKQSIVNKQPLPDIPNGIVMLVVGLAGSKAFQRFSEK